MTLEGYRLTPEEIDNIANEFIKKFGWIVPDKVKNVDLKYQFIEVFKAGADAQLSKLSQVTNEKMVEEIARLLFNQDRIARGLIVENYWEYASKTSQDYWLKIARQLLAPVNLKIAEAVEKAKKEERENFLKDLKDSLKLIIRFMNTPEAKKDITDSLRITLRDMMIGTWQALKGTQEVKE